MKIPLQIRKPFYGYSGHWDESEPFVLNDRGLLIHRPRSVTKHHLTGHDPHIGITYWCGNSATGNDNLHFIDAPPEGMLVCAICEERAKMFGEKSSDELAGKHIHKGRVKAVQTCCGGNVDETNI